MKDEIIQPLVPESLKKTLEVNQKIASSISPFIEQQKHIQEVTRAVNSSVPQIVIENPIKGIIDNILISSIPKPIIPKSILLAETIGKSVLDFSNILPNYQIDFGISSAVKALNSTIASSVASSLQGIIGNMGSAIIDAVKSPLIQWLQSVDFSPFLSILQNLNFDKIDLERYERLNEKYLQSMYQFKWFPYAGWIADIGLFAEVNEILDTSRGISKRCEKRVDKAILSYYTKSQIKQIKREWKNSDLGSHIKKALGQTLEAYLRKEYALVIPFLATMWEGIIKEKTYENTKNHKDDFKKLVDANGFGNIYSDFYINMIIGTCYSVDDVIDGVPNRHSVAHSWYLKYPSKKAALNSILLTDFLIKLEPKTNKITEEK